MSRQSGLCPVCRRVVGVRKDGLLRGHGPARKPCQGWLQRPVSRPGSVAPGLGWPIGGIGDIGFGARR